VSTADVPRADARPSLVRLTLVELRKMVDTRAGFWLLLSTAVMTPVITAIYCTFADADVDLAGALEVAIQPASILLPIMGVLLVTSEWSQRTGMITFALVPHRTRVLAAKVTAGVLLALGAMVICAPIATVGAALAAPADSEVWLSAGLLGRVTLSMALGMLQGLFFGAMLLNSASAIVLYFVLPLVGAGVGSIPSLQGFTEWIDVARALAPLTADTMSRTEWAHAGTSVALWLGLPLLIGVWRITRSEVR